MRTDDLDRSLPDLLNELVHGAPEGGAFILNPGDPGLLASLRGLSAEAASAASAGGGSIAAHAEHLRFGISLLNRWAAGEENPFQGADWAAAWRRSRVTEGEWREIQEGLRAELERWGAALREPREIAGMELDGVIGSLIHLGYHFGAMRQIEPAARGPRATDAA